MPVVMLWEICHPPWADQGLVPWSPAVLELLGRGTYVPQGWAWTLELAMGRGLGPPGAALAGALGSSRSQPQGFLPRMLCCGLMTLILSWASMAVDTSAAVVSEWGCSCCRSVPPSLESRGSLLAASSGERQQQRMGGLSLGFTLLP